MGSFGDLFKENVAVADIKPLSENEEKTMFSFDNIRDIETRTLNTLGVMFILDHSNSMIIDNRIDQVNEGLKLFVEDLKATQAEGNVCFDIGVVSMGGSNAKLLREFQGLDLWEDLTLNASGVTPLHEAAKIASDNIHDRLRLYETKGIGFYKPWVVILSDGVPTDDSGQPLSPTDERIRESKRFLRETGCLVYTFYIGDASGDYVEDAKTILRELATYNDTQDESKGKMSYVLSERKDSIKELFRFLSNSVNVVSSFVVQRQNNTTGGFISLFDKN